jgi:hypothetical protein
MMKWIGFGVVVVMVMVKRVCEGSNDGSMSKDTVCLCCEACARGVLTVDADDRFFPDPGFVDDYPYICIVCIRVFT